MASQEITRADASKKMNKRKGIVTKIFNALSDISLNTSTGNHFEPIQVSNKDEQRNAFVFSRNLVAEIFFGKSVEEMPKIFPKNSPKYLLVILGAHFQDEPARNFKQGQSTIILIGANETSPGSGKFTTVRPTSIGSSPQTSPSAPEQDSDIVGIEFPPSFVMEDVKKRVDGNKYVYINFK